MVTRQHIKETFLAELEGVVSTWVPAADVTLRRRDTASSPTPSVQYEEFATPVRYNRGSKQGHAKVKRDANGNATGLIYYTYSGVTFEVTVLGENEAQKEPIYEAIVKNFEQYKLWRSTDDFCPAVQDIDVDDMGGADVAESDSVLRGDRISVYVEFLRDHELSVEAIQAINSEFDINNDDVVDLTTTTDSTNAN